VSQWSDAFTEVFDAVQPTVEPVLTYGGGVTADATKELDRIILASARGTPWSASLVVTYGQIVFPSVRMGRRFKVVQAGTMAATEPTWPEYDYGFVSSGTAELVEDGPDYANVYDIRRAIYKALDAKVQKSVNQNQYIQDSRAQASSYLYLNLVRERDRYASVGIA
jgi:hypothetical protein